MENAYISAMIDSLKKKIVILEEIHKKDEEQLELAKSVLFSYEAFDKNSEEKGVLIYKLTKLDEGFELVYQKIRDEFKEHKNLYKEEIRTMQNLITKITELSTKIQAEEARNKAALESTLKSERERLKTARSSVKAIQSYNQTMMSKYSGLSNTWE